MTLGDRPRERSPAASMFSISGCPLLLLLIGFLLTASCTKPQAFGTENAVMVLAPDGLWPTLQPAVEAGLEGEFVTSRPEEIFVISAGSLEDPGDFLKWRRLLLLGYPGIGAPLDRFLDRDARQTLARGEGVMVTAGDVWARGQEVVALVAPGQADLLPLVRARMDTAFTLFHSTLVERERDRMFASGKNRELAKRLGDQYGFTLTLPNIYNQLSPGDEPPPLRFLNVNPERVILIHWEESPRRSLDPKDLIALREELAKRYYRPGDRIDPERVRTEETEVSGQPAVRLHGVWTNDEEIASGPFLSYALNCPNPARFFLIDGELFAPDRPKYPYMVQLETLLRSFQCVQS